MILVPYRAQHALDLELQPAQAGEFGWADRAMLEALEGPWAFTGYDRYGHIVGCAGIQPAEFGSGVLWSFLGVDARRHLVPITKAALRLLELAQLRRVTATTPCDFGAGCRWLSLLGFQVEGAMRSYAPDGRDHFLYSRIR